MIRSGTLLLLLLLGTAGAQAPQAAGQESVLVSAVISPPEVAAGAEVMLAVRATIPAGFHVYGIAPPELSSIPTSIALEDSSSFIPSGALREPRPATHYDEVFEVDVPWHSGTPEFTLPIRLSPSLAPGVHAVRGLFGYQLCDEKSCRIPTEAPFAAEVTVTGTVVAQGTAPPPPIIPAVTLDLSAADEAPAVAAEGGVKVLATFVGYDPSEERFLAFLRSRQGAVAADTRGGILPFVGGAILAGLLSILTPCVFPMIPITISFFSRMASGLRRESVLLAGTYSIGIIVAYTAIGLLVSILLGAGGVQNIASSPVMNLVLAGVLMFFTLNLLGMFEIRVSSGGMSGAQRQGRAGRVLTVLLMALGFTLASFTCTAGFVGALLVAASQGEVSWPLIGMLAYSTAFAFPFFLLALFPGWLASLPQAGGWMNRIKVAMGFLIFAATFKFLSNADAVLQWGLLSRTAVLTIWVITFLFLGLYLMGKLRLPHDEAEAGAVSVPRMFLSLAAFALALHLAFGLAGKPVWGALDGLLPPAESAASEEWSEDYDAALVQARREGKPVFVDFSGYTCTNCKLMEHKIFTLPAVQREFEKFVRVRLFTDGGPQKKRNQHLAQELGGTLALPLYVVLEPSR
ncbi:MAG: thioredoxin family protein [Candidatus Eisenbacteria bacterium]|nr:thioredoxin family protein [Candidatus Eisenbacteria bacterium]